MHESAVRLFRARQAAMAAVPPGPRPYNPVVLPGEALGRPGTIAVYILAAEEVPGEMVFGVHYRALLSGDGTTVKQMLPLSKSALVIPPPKHGAPEGALVTQLVTDWPIETHVFISLLHRRIPIYVGTARGIWCVVGDQITLIDARVPRSD